MSKFELMKCYQQNDGLRAAFDTLARNTFSISFEDWYKKGYWTDNFLPYSIVTEDKLVANVCVAEMVFAYEKEEVTLLQLGTVMTDPAYRNQGLIRRLIKEIEGDYEGRAAGYFLFANPSVTAFYPKFGYKKQPIIGYTRLDNDTAGKENETRSVQKADLRDADTLRKLEKSIEGGIAAASFSVIRDVGIYMFHIKKFLSEDVYYLPELFCFAVAEKEGDTVEIYGVFAEEQSEKQTEEQSKKQIDEALVIRSLEAYFAKTSGNIREITLNYTPLFDENYKSTIITSEDTTFFAKGSFFETFSERGLTIPALSYT